MIRKTWLTAVAAIYMFGCYGQENNPTPAGKRWYQRKPDFYIGVQANQLLKQLINLNNSSTNLNNPYLITASVNWPDKGWGIHGGFGYNYQNTTDELTPANHQTKISDVFYRAGINRRVMLGKHFEAGFGADYTGSYQFDQTFSENVTNFSSSSDSTVAVSYSKVTGQGFGLQFLLAFYITPHILLSTEATYYYNKSEIKNNVTINDYFVNKNNADDNSTTMTVSNTSKVQKTVTFSLPVALFLVIKI